MRKHSSIPSTSCPGAPKGLQPVQLSMRAFQRYLRPSALVWSPAVGFQVYRLPCGCFVWVHYSGLRFLSGLPF